MNNYIQHHGVLGQMWGKKNGPPYPLGASDHSASEKKAGWRKSLSKSEIDKTDNKRYNKDDVRKRNLSLTDKQKKAIAIGAAAVASGLIVYGAYKTGALDKFVNIGKQTINVNDSTTVVKQVTNINNESSYGSAANILGTDFLSVNQPNMDKYGKGHVYSSQNCLNCAMAIEAKFRGKNVIASPAIDKKSGLVWNTGRKLKDLLRPFGVKSDDLLKFKSNSWDSVNDYLIQKYGENSRGVLALRWADNRGHFVNWWIHNGQVIVLDGQSGTYYPILKLKGLTSSTKTNFILRTDNLDLIYSALDEFVDR